MVKATSFCPNRITRRSQGFAARPYHYVPSPSTIPFFTMSPSLADLDALVIQDNKQSRGSAPDLAESSLSQSALVRAGCLEVQSLAAVSSRQAIASSRLRGAP